MILVQLNLPLSACFVTLCMLLGCQSLGNRQNRLSDHEGMGDFDFIEGITDVTKVPEALWSPEQRRLMASYYFLLGEISGLKGEHKLASRAMHNAYNLDPNPYIGAKVLEGEIRIGQEDSLDNAERMALVYPKSAELHFQLAQARLQARMVTQAVSALERCLDLDRKHERAHLLLIQIYLATSQREDAAIASKAMIRELPNSIVPRTILSKIYLSQDRYQEARETIEVAYDQQQSHPEVILLYALSLELTGESARAVALYELLYRMNIESDELVERMLQIYREIGNLNQALGIVEELLSGAGAQRAGTLFQKAIILWELERFEESEQILLDLHQGYPQSDRVLYLLGLSSERKKEFEKAIEFYDQVDGRSQIGRAARMRKAVSLRAMKNYDGAIAIVDSLFNEDSKEWDLYVLAADLHAHKKKFKQALIFIADAERDFPEQKSKALFLTAVYLEKSGQRERCIEVLRNLIEREAQNAAALNFLGYLFVESEENLDEAEELIKRALAVKADDGFYLDSLGWLYFKKGDYVKALEVLLLADQAAPGEGVILEHLAEVYLKLGDEGKAKEYYRRALKGNIDERDLGRISKRARQLGAVEGS